MNIEVEPNWILWISLVVLGYFIGAIPTGYLVAKKLTGQDIREVGSGSTGATNVRRVAGKKAFWAVMLLDFFKGFGPLALMHYGLLPDQYWLHVLMGGMVLIGHSRSVFLGFNGGKSAASGLGTVFALSPITAFCVALTAFLVIKIMRMVSLGSLTAAVLTPIILFALHEPLAYIVYAMVMALYVFYLHRENVQRLIKGTESKLD